MDIEAEGTIKYPQIKTYFTLNLPHHKDSIIYLNKIGYRALGIDIDPEDKKERIVFIKEVNRG